jgi:ribose 1,5-bisphosphate isomerase
LPAKYPNKETIPQKVLEIAKDIKEMRIRGAGKIARAAAEALEIAATQYAGEDDKFREYMREIGRLLIKTRPTAVSLPNAVFFVLTRMDRASGEPRTAVIKAAREFIELSLKAREKLGEIGSRLIDDGDIVMTHCHSTAVVSVLKTAWNTGKRFTVINTETRPKFQGRITALQLAEIGIPVTHTTDSAVRYHMKKVDKVIVGADTVTSDGHLINKVGTSQIALAAYEAGKPFYSATESIKFSPASFAGGQVIIEERPGTEVTTDPEILENYRIKIRNPAFDITDPRYVTGFITELGIIPPHAAALVIKEMFGLESGYQQLKMIEEETDTWIVTKMVRI